MPCFKSSCTSRFAAAGLIAERLFVSSSIAEVMASGGSVGFSFSKDARNLPLSTASVFTIRPSVPLTPKVSSAADTVSQPRSSNSPIAGCSTSWSSV